MDDARFRLFVGGRGSGKTRGGAIEALRQPAGSVGLIAAPNYPMLRLGAMETVLQLVAQAGIGVSWNKTEKELVLIGNRKIIFRSADDPASFRGANVGWFWLDEVAYMQPEVWETIVPTLRYAPGRGWATTTPKGKTWVYDLWNTDDPDYSVVTSSSSQNIFLPSHYINTLKRAMTSDMYEQEVEGRFIDPIGQLFKRDWFKRVERAPEDLKWYRYWDLAASTKTSADFTASVRIAFAPDGTLYIDKGIHVKAEWPDVRKLIIETAMNEPDVQLGIEEALHGLAAVQELRREPRLQGYSLKGIRVDKDKLSRAMPWASLAEEGKVRIVTGGWVKEYLDEVMSFPSAKHDDYVDATSGAVAMAKKSKIQWGFA
jgi:predicted phage terminase large subunit-like protein